MAPAEATFTTLHTSPELTGSKQITIVYVHHACGFRAMDTPSLGQIVRFSPLEIIKLMRWYDSASVFLRRLYAYSVIWETTPYNIIIQCMYRMHMECYKI